MYKLWPDEDIQVHKARVAGVPLLILHPQHPKKNAPGVLWIHGGGYILGMKEMVYMSRALDLVKNYGAVVVSPGYRLAWLKPYPAALHDCYAALKFMSKNADRLGIDPAKIMVGGESAGGGLTAAVCMMATCVEHKKKSYRLAILPSREGKKEGVAICITRTAG